MKYLFYLQMLNKLIKQIFLVGDVKHLKRSRKLGQRGVLKVPNIFRDDFSVNDEEALTLHHVRDHVNAVVFGIRKLKRSFLALDIEGEYSII